MRSIGDIREHSRIAARKAAQDGLRPFVVEADDLADFHLTVRAGARLTFPFPFLGDHAPAGFTPTENRYFVDATGVGTECDPALPPLAFVKRLREGYGYAVVETGPFQVYVQEYEPARLGSSPRSMPSHSSCRDIGKETE